MAHTISYTNKGGEMPYSAIATAKVTLDVSEALVLEFGFHPSRVEIIMIDVTDGSANFMGVWIPSMTANHYIHVTQAGVISEATSLGPVLYTAAGAGLGITIPANQTGAADNDVLYVTAFR